MTLKMQQLVTSPHTSLVAESSTNFPAVSQSSDDINRYQPPNSKHEGYFDNFFQKTLVGVVIFGFRRNFTFSFSLHLMTAT